MSSINLEAILDKHFMKYTEEFKKENQKFVILQAMEEACLECIRKCNREAYIDETTDGYIIKGILPVIDKIKQ